MSSGPPHMSRTLSDQAASAALVRGIAERDGKLDILALAAGGVCGLADLPLEGVTEDNWNQVFAANLKAALWLSQAAAPIMQRAGWGRIVIISSRRRAAAQPDGAARLHLGQARRSWTDEAALRGPGPGTGSPPIPWRPA